MVFFVDESRRKMWGENMSSNTGEKQNKPKVTLFKFKTKNIDFNWNN